MSSFLGRKKRGGTIQVGSTVTVKRGKERTERQYIIVGMEEADAEQGKISYNSPLGKALVGAGKGDGVEAHTPAGAIKYIIVDVK